jgi:hypothetical protein
MHEPRGEKEQGAIPHIHDDLVGVVSSVTGGRMIEWSECGEERAASLWRVIGSAVLAILRTTGRRGRALVSKDIPPVVSACCAEQPARPSLAAAQQQRGLPSQSHHKPDLTEMRSFLLSTEHRLCAPE